ncbi:related to D-arabinono-1,4-lactone oxidase [Cephalotrichum gorgonifer]|uniref:D-arabinono-1,4-lactone oxidase n=1 Tax=Cephalotrichum gorgonifer TaxID=2041049 RepID=A0AAE8STL9_9PEZI|nr:related to D-arabinono-1,4-lactone oxidase [Cephalotrichum gorgonifer]
MSQLSVIQQELDNPTDGIHLHATRKHIHATWALTFSSAPELYFQPESVEEVQKIIRLAHQCRRRVVVVGSGHSPSHLTCTSHWLVNLDKLNAILETDGESKVVRVQAGIRLRDLCAELDKRDLDMANLGSINEQSMAGVISTGTHGSSLRHGLVSENVLGFKIVIADGSIQECSATSNNELFRAGLISLGALGIIVEVTYQAVPNFRLHWQQTIDSDRKLFSQWSTDFWAQREFIRVWWLPHTRRAVTWSADRTEEPNSELPYSYFDGALGYYLYHNLLYVGHWIPRILPWVEWFMFGIQYSFKNGTTTSAVQPSRKALLLNCLYSQYVNEWALPLSKGPEALRRLSTWLNNLSPDDPDYMEHGIPFSSKGIYIHAPLEVRVTNSVPATPEAANSRPFLDASVADGPTLYLNATLYRPYHTDPACRQRYYEAFEYLMNDLGGRPHWAKNFLSDKAAIENMYGEDLERWRRVREEVDPEGMFVGPWHREKVVDGPPLPLEETLEEGVIRRDSTGARRVIGWVRG